MSTRFMRAVIAGSSALGAGLLVPVLGMMPALAATPHIGTFRPGHVIWNAVHSNVTRAQAVRAAATSGSFKRFTATVKTESTSYTYVMAGKKPSKQVTNPSSTIKVELVPLVMKFANGDTWDPTQIDSCDSGASPLTRVQQSPLVVKQKWTWGGTSLGTAQVTDAFQRAEFWKYAQPAGINPTYSVNLSWTTATPITINVPSVDAAVAPIGCGSGLLGATEINWLNSDLQSTVIPSLGIGPATVPVFLLHNFVEYQNTTANCCALGYHSAYNVAAGVQTYGVAMYDNSGAFSGSADISALSHEVAEWQNDPYDTNPTPSWGKIGQVAGCQANLEVGDPPTGTTYTDTFAGFTYHPQELAFSSWFYHQSPSLGVNGWCSDQGTFRAPAAAC